VHGQALALNLHKSAALQQRRNALQALATSDDVEVIDADTIVAQKQ
jgi:hypothetical protein